MVGDDMASRRRRSAVVLVDDGHVALIRRHRGGELYHLFPGGGVELGESDEMAAVREANEELGLQVEVVRPLGTVIYGTSAQMYFEVRMIGGQFGTGTGPEMSSSVASDAGSHEAIWLPLDELPNVDVRPAALASMLANGSVPPVTFALVEASSPEGGDADRVLVSVAAYSDRADDYEATHAAKMADRVDRFAGSLPAPSLVLDAGCGPGRDLARFVAHGHVARGVDLNPAFVEKASAHAPTVEADLRSIGSLYPPATFDGIWAAASLVHLSDDEVHDVLRQFGAVLRPGGRLFACLKSEGETGWMDEPDGTRWYTVWPPDAFAAAVTAAGFVVDETISGPFVEVWASRR